YNMKVVIKISGRDVCHQNTARKLARVASQLISEGHCLTIVHGGMGAVLDAASTWTVDPERRADESWQKDMALMFLGGKINKQFIAAMAAAGVPSFGLCGADGNVVRARKRLGQNCKNCPAVDVAVFDPFWIDAITRRGGVPVIASMGLTPDGQYHYLDANHLAAECAISWNADALILLTRDTGIKDEDGSVIRWLIAEHISPGLTSN